MTTDTDTTVTAEVTVEAPIEPAFHVFTERFASWWPAEFRIGPVDMAEAVMEGREGGRWYERGVDGRETPWGTVLAWDPPHLVRLSWQLTPSWGPEPDAAKASEVTVRFTAESGTTTRVVLEHSGLDRHGEGWEALRGAVGDEAQGWPVLLQAYAAVAAKSEEG